jgi:hypothetical protein
MALEAQNNPFTSVLMVEAADPEALPDADPSAGQRRLAVGTDHLLYLVSDSGVKTAVGGGGIANPLATDSLWDAAGDLVQGSGANTAAKLSAGTAGKVLTSNGAAAALTWETPSGAGAEFATQDTKIATAQNTSSGSFVDLSTAGPSVTLTVGASGKVKLTMACNVFNTSATENYVGIVISGASTVAVATYMNLPTAASGNHMSSRTVLLTGLSTGSTTFKMQYAVAAGTGTFSLRELLAEAVF